MSPVRWQKVEARFGQGLDTKNHPFGLDLGKLTTARNVSFTKGGAIGKRNGFTQVGGTLFSPKALFSYGDQLVAQANGQLMAYSSALGAWEARGSCRSVVTSSEVVAQSSNSCRSTDCATAHGITVYGWLSLGDHLAHYMVVDEPTGAVLVPDTAISSFVPLYLQVVASGTTIAVVYSGAGNVVWRALSTSSPTSLAPEVTIVGSTTNRFRMVDNGAGFGLLYRPNSTNDNKVAKVSTAGSVTATSSAFGSAYSSALGGYALAFINNRYFAAYENLAGDLSCAVLSSALAVAGTVTVETSLSTSYAVKHATLANDGSGNAYVIWDAQKTGDPTYNRFTRAAVVSTSATIAKVRYDVMRSVSVASDAVYLDGSVYFWAKYYSATRQIFGTGSVLQVLTNSVYVLLDVSRNIVARALAYGQAGEASSSINSVPGMAVVGTGQYLSALLAVVPTESTASRVAQVITGLAGVRADFGSERPRAAQIGESLLVAGGAAHDYDGASAVEAGWLVWPEAATDLTDLETWVAALAAWSSSSTRSAGSYTKPTSSNGHFYICTVGGTTGGSEPAWPTASGGTVTDGTVTWVEAGATTGAMDGSNWGYIVAPEWLNSRGELVRGPPSPVAHGGVAGTGVVLTLPTLRLTQKTNSRLAIYRSVSQGSIYYRIDAVANDTTVDSFLYFDRLGDENAISGSPLYTTGGELPAVAPPACTVVAVRGSRIYSNDTEDPQAVVASKPRVVGYCAEWNPLFKVYSDPSGGPVVALATMDDKTVVFQDRRISYLGGDGPDATGSGSFYALQTVSPDMGCINPDSVAVMPQGIFFQSSKGFYVLGRDLQLRYVGAAVEANGQMLVASAQVAPGTTELRVLASDAGADESLVWDFFWDQWGSSNLLGVDAAIWNGAYVYIDTSAKVGKETEDNYVDLSGQAIARTITTGWISFDGIQGYQRVRKFELLGDWTGDLDLAVSALWNYGGEQGGSYSWPSQTLEGLAVNAWQRGFYLPTQKIESVQLTFSETAGTDPTVAGSLLVGLAFEVGLKGGLYRLPAGQKTG